MKQSGMLLRSLVGLLLFWMLFWLWSRIIRSRKEMSTEPDVLGYYLYEKAIDAGFNKDTAKYVVSQAAHETGNFTSALLRKITIYLE